MEQTGAHGGGDAQGTGNRACQVAGEPAGDRRDALSYPSAKEWQRVLLWLVLAKLAYLGLTCTAIWLGSAFDEERLRGINARWFEVVGAQPPKVTERIFSRHFATWDAEHYLYLSEHGYRQGVPSCAFYPLWPLLIRWFSVLTGGSHLLAGLLLANVFSLAAWVIFHCLVARRFGDKAGFWALVLIIIFPGSLFYQFVYSESLFFLLVMLLWYGLERDRLAVAWLAAFLLPLTRAVGVFSLLPIGWYVLQPAVAWLQAASRAGVAQTWSLLYRRLVVGRVSEGQDAVQASLPQSSPSPSRLKICDTADYKSALRGSEVLRRAWLLAAPLAGWGLYLALMWHWTGNAFEGFEAQKYWGAHAISNLWDLPKFVIGFCTPTAWHGFSGSVLDRCAFLLLLYCLPLVWRAGKDMLVWTYVLGILSAMSGTFVSFTRFESTAFPLFVALAVFFSRLKSRWPLMIFIALSAGLHVLLAWRFVNFRWAG